jgi:RNA polymerase sigma-70 factor (ECF subfamily)
MVYNLALKLVGEPGEAENILQETFLKVFEKLDTFRAESSLQTWIYRIATNAALMAIRQRRGDLVEFDEEADFTPAAKYQRMLNSLSRSPLDLLLDAEFKRALEKAMADLPDSWRIPFVLKDIEGFSLQDIADELNTTVPSVKAALHRGRNALRDTLADFIDGTERKVRRDRRE